MVRLGDSNRHVKMTPGNITGIQRYGWVRFSTILSRFAFDPFNHHGGS